MTEPGPWEYEHVTITWTQVPDSLGSTARRPWTTVVALAGAGQQIARPEVPYGVSLAGSLVGALNHLGDDGWELASVGGWDQRVLTSHTWSALIRRPRRQGQGVSG